MRTLSALLALASGAFVALTAEAAEASIAERVVAVVADEPILLSELRQRARPHAKDTAALRSALDRMIDERLEDTAATRENVTVSADEVDAAIREVAAQARMPTSLLLAEVERQGRTEAQFRRETRYRLLDEKMVRLHVSRRVVVTEADVRTAYERSRKALAANPEVDVRLIVLQVPPGSSRSAVQAIERTAQHIVDRARAGESFCRLARQYNPGASPWGCGGSGLVPMPMLFPELARAIAPLKPGETADPIAMRAPTGDDAIVVAQLHAVPVPELELVREQMVQRAKQDLAEQQRRLWLRELRRNAHVDIRL